MSMSIRDRRSELQQTESFSIQAKKQACRALKMQFLKEHRAAFDARQVSLRFSALYEKFLMIQCFI